MSEPAGRRRSDESGEPRDPEPLARAYAVCAGCIGTGALFFLGGVVPLPVLLYFPLSRRFGFTPRPPELAMDFYGRSLLALGAGLFAALATYAVARWLGARRSAAGPAQAEADAATDADAGADELAATPEPSVARGTLATAYAATALLLAAGLWAYQLYARQPSPEPLPPGYFLRCPPAKPAPLAARAADGL